MNIEKQAYFKNRLIEEEEKLSKAKDNIMEGRQDLVNKYYSELSGYDNHPGDIGTEVFMKEQDEGFRINIENKLKDINVSLGMIEDGSYGICNNCRQNINEERLDLIPYAKTCQECMGEEVKIDFRQLESIEDKYAKSNSNNPASNVIYDREDAYQDVGGYNIVPGDPSMSTGDNIGLSDDEETDGVDRIENISQEYYDNTLK